MSDPYIDDGGPLNFTPEGFEAVLDDYGTRLLAEAIKQGWRPPGPNASPQLKAATGSRVFRVHRDENGRIAAMSEETVR